MGFIIYNILYVSFKKYTIFVHIYKFLLVMSILSVLLALPIYYANLKWCCRRSVWSTIGLRRR